MRGRRFLAAALAFAFAFAAWGSEWRGFVARSSRAQNSSILELLLESDLSLQLEILSALGERKDPYVSDILEGIRSGFDSGDVYGCEYLCRVLIASILAPSLPSEVLRERAQANKSVLDGMIRGMREVSDPMLRLELVHAMELLPEYDYSPCVSEQLGLSLERMRDADGNAEPSLRALVLSLLSFAARHPRTEFLKICMDVSRSVRDSLIVDSARAAVKIIREASR